ncbi:MAG TPA: hypothetical protein VHM30_01130 [Gemmatimonadaceae bacterium]|nr:hypothetical protein [Gemmatimonadaceae bacterium]
MERNEELRNEDARDSGREAERASELRDADLRRADEGEGFTHSDSLVRDDSLVAGRSSDELADRTDRTNRNVEDIDVGLANARESITADNVVHHHDHPTVGDQVGEAAGGISGVLAGAAIGSLGGPVGTVIGGIAGAIGGWWAGRAISEAASNFSHADDAHFRSDYEARDAGEARSASRSYEAVRPAYQLGYLASRNPDYVGRSFDEIEPDLQRGWSSSANNTGTADWDEMREYARTAYVRGAASQSSLTGDSQDKSSLSSTGTTGSVGTSDDLLGDPSMGTGSTRLASGNVADVIDNGTAFSGTSDVSGARDAAGRLEQGSEIGGASESRSYPLGGGASSSTNDPSYPGASPRGSMTYQTGERLTQSSTDSSGPVRSETFDNVGNRERELRANESGERPGYTDPVAGEGVENIGSSGLAPRGDVSDEQSTLNETPRTEETRDKGEDQSQRY